MKSDATPPDDAAADPLLATLRQRLGDYGAAPPPAAWAAIRQRLAPPVRPWWRRPRRLLPLLALLLGVLGVATLGEQRGWRKGAARLASHRPGGTSSLTGQPGSASRPALPAAISHLPEAASATLPLADRQPTTSATRARPLAATPVAAPTSSARQAILTTAPGATLPLAAQQLTKVVAPDLHSATHLHRPNSRHRAPQQAAGATLKAGVPHASSKLVYARGLRAGQRTYVAATTQPMTHESVAAYPYFSATSAGHGRRWAGARRRRAGGEPISSVEVPPATVSSAELKATKTGRSTSATATLASRSEPGAAAFPTAPATHQDSLALPTPMPAGRGTALGLLALKQPSLFLSPLALPAAPAARPDSMLPPPPVRRWAVLLVAGPTLSYRTLGPAPVLAAGHPDFARLERPALGWGAQVQGRRVLSGRWALAAGLGYHEYATRLALTRDSLQSIHQRDTYRLLTLPVQLTYALGAPHGRLATGLLLGAEAGWYVGGRSTEGSGCGCEQQAYASAAASPYRPWSLAFSLGLDLRYQLGGPASRWRWVVQPTGRYVATPFVRSEAVGFTRRQPFSLGLLTGFSWDVR